MIRQNEASAPEPLWGTGKESFAAALKLSHGVGSSGELREAENGETLNTGRRTNFFWHPFCRIYAAFHLATERRIRAAAKNCVVRP